MRSVLIVALTIFPVLAFAASLPLQPGNYVETGVACDHAFNAVSLVYDGENLTGAHSVHCRTTVLAKQGHTYTLRQDCPAEQIGPQSAQSYHEMDTLTIVSAQSFHLVHPGADGGATHTADFRRCSI